MNLLLEAVSTPERSASDTVAVYLLGSILNRTSPGENLLEEVCIRFPVPLMLLSMSAIHVLLSQVVVGVGSGVIANSQNNEQVIVLQYPVASLHGPLYIFAFLVECHHN